MNLVSLDFLHFIDKKEGASQKQADSIKYKSGLNLEILIDATSQEWQYREHISLLNFFPLVFDRSTLVQLYWDSSVKTSGLNKRNNQKDRMIAI